MIEFEALYDQFQITAEKCDNLRWLADPKLHFSNTTDRVVVETIIVENGERRILRKEEQSAKLV